MFSKNLKFYLSALLICVLVVGGTVFAENVKTVVNNYYSDTTTVNQNISDSGSDTFGAVTAVGGVCDGSEPTTQLCNVNAYELQVQTDVTVDDDLIVTGDILGGVGVVTQSSTTNEVLTQTQICGSNYIAYTPINALSLTLPATSTVTSCLNTAGAMRTIVLENAATTTIDITIAAGAGMDLQEPDGQNVVIGQNNYAFITFVKQTNGDMVVRVDETIPAD